MDFVPVMIDYGMCIDIIVYKFLVFVYFFEQSFRLQCKWMKRNKKLKNNCVLFLAKHSNKSHSRLTLDRYCVQYNCLYNALHHNFPLILGKFNDAWNRSDIWRNLKSKPMKQWWRGSRTLYQLMMRVPSTGSSRTTIFKKSFIFSKGRLIRI